MLKMNRTLLGLALVLLYLFFDSDFSSILTGSAITTGTIIPIEQLQTISPNDPNNRICGVNRPPADMSLEPFLRPNLAPSILQINNTLDAPVQFSFASYCGGLFPGTFINKVYLLLPGETTIINQGCRIVDVVFDKNYLVTTQVGSIWQPLILKYYRDYSTGFPYTRCAGFAHSLRSEGLGAQVNVTIDNVIM
jgi:hypothetical protein